MAIEIDQRTCDSLAAKLNRLDLNEAEGALLSVLLTAGADHGDEVEGFQLKPPAMFRFNEVKLDVDSLVVIARPGEYKVVINHEEQ